MKLSVTKILSFCTLFILGTSCIKKEVKPVTPDPIVEEPVKYAIPVTYNFSNKDYTSATEQVMMVQEIAAYIRSTHTSTQSTQPVLDENKLKNMFTNANSPFTAARLNSSTTQLKSFTEPAFVFLLESSFTDAAAASSVAAASPTITTASDGVKGKLVSPSRAILVNAKGFEYKEFAEKGFMGALIYHQATTLLNTLETFDNAALVNQATAQERAWDQAFGYFGIPEAFPTTTVGVALWGSYCNSLDAAIACNATMMNAFLKGRAAISNKDNAARNEAREILLSNWERIAAAKCINYLKGAKTNLADKATAHHNLSEAYGFIIGFKYNPKKKISDADITTLTNYIGTNLYEITQENIDNAISKLATLFALDASKL